MKSIWLNPPWVQDGYRCKGEQYVMHMKSIASCLIDKYRLNYTANLGLRLPLYFRLRDKIEKINEKSA